MDMEDLTNPDLAEMSLDQLRAEERAADAKGNALMGESEVWTVLDLQQVDWQLANRLTELHELIAEREREGRPA